VLRRPHRAHTRIRDNDRIRRAEAVDGIAHLFGSEFSIGSAMLDICVDVLHGSRVTAEDFMQKFPVFAARFDTREQRVQSFSDVATKPQFQRDAAPKVRGIAVDLNDPRLLRKEIDVGKIRSQHNEYVAPIHTFL
jgi:hypothetical protein